MALIDTLTAVEFLTEDDPYHYTIENRPLQNLKTRDEELASAIDTLSATVGTGGGGSSEFIQEVRSIVVGTSAVAAATSKTDCVVIGDSALSLYDGAVTGTVVIGSGAASQSAGSYITEAVVIGAGAGASGEVNGSVVIGKGASGDSVGNGTNHCVTVGSYTMKSGYFDFCVAVGYGAMPYSNGSAYNTCVGTESMGYSVTSISGSNNTAIGYRSLYRAVSGTYNTAIGNEAMGGVATNISGSDNIAIGHQTLYSIGTGFSNITLGTESSKLVTSGYHNTVVGTFAVNNATTGNKLTALGTNSLSYLTSGSSLVSTTNSTGVGAYTRVSGDNQVQLGDSATTTYVYGTVQNRSDIRDKADVRDTVLGLDFINRLRPVDYKWDMRDDYIVQEADAEGKPTVVILPKDGSKKRSRYHHGLIAQEVKQVIEDTGVDFGGYQDHSVGGGCDVLSIGYDELVAPLIKAVQELSAQVVSLQAEVTALKNG